MDDVTFNQQKGRVTPLVERWRDIMGLASWRIDIQFVRDQVEFMRSMDINDGLNAVMDIGVKWEYKQACLRVNTLATAEMDDEDTERAVIHELTHCLVAEMRDWTPRHNKHEERVVCEVTEAILRAYNAGTSAQEEAA